MTIETIQADFEFLDDWEDRYRYVIELGRRLERSLQIISLVKNCFIPLPEMQGPVLETALEIADSLMTYRSRYLANLQLAAVLDLLLTDEINPRSLAYRPATSAGDCRIA